jgi:hypothetical protein
MRLLRKDETGHGISFHPLEDIQQWKFGLVISFFEII